MFKISISRSKNVPVKDLVISFGVNNKNAIKVIKHKLSLTIDYFLPHGLFN